MNLTKEQQEAIEEIMNELYPIEGVIGHFHISQRMVFEKGAQEVLNNPEKYGLKRIEE